MLKSQIHIMKHLHLLVTVFALCMVSQVPALDIGPDPGPSVTIEAIAPSFTVDINLVEQDITLSSFEAPGETFAKFTAVDSPETIVRPWVVRCQEIDDPGGELKQVERPRYEPSRRVPLWPSLETPVKEPDPDPVDTDTIPSSSSRSSGLTNKTLTGYLSDIHDKARDKLTGCLESYSAAAIS